MRTWSLRKGFLAQAPSETNACLCGAVAVLASSLPSPLGYLPAHSSPSKDFYLGQIFFLLFFSLGGG